MCISRLTKMKNSKVEFAILRTSVFTKNFSVKILSISSSI